MKRLEKCLVAGCDPWKSKTTGEGGFTMVTNPYPETSSVVRVLVRRIVPVQVRLTIVTVPVGIRHVAVRQS
jgi:hypothetical protein